MQKRKRYQEHARTLIALVVTLVVLLILAGITIYAILGENGIFHTANDSKTEHRKGEILDQLNVAESDISSKALGKLSIEEYIKYIQEEGIVIEAEKQEDGSYEVTTEDGYVFNISIIEGKNTNDIVIEYKSQADNLDPSVPEEGYDEEKGVNIPKLTDEMTPVIWDPEAENQSGTKGDWVEVTNIDEWYNYKDEEVNGVEAKRWANAMTKDGSLWVWIPRYAYQIQNQYHTNSTTGGTINIEFLKGTTNEGATGKTIIEYNEATTSNYSKFPNGYVVHPGFEYKETATGLWVAKFEASQSDAGANTKSYQNYTGGSSGIIKIQPGVNSWRNITLSEMYTKCLDYAETTLGNSSLNSHLMKNSEWGAVAYLSKSEYGKNGEIWINPNSNYLTGQAGKTVSQSGTTSTYSYTNTTYGVQASTTGNIYGIYDMSGGTYEYTAAYVENSYLKDKTSSLYSNGKALIEGDSWTKDVYVDGTTIGGSDTREDNYEANKGKYGDAIYETSSSTSPLTNSWYQDYSGSPRSTYPYFRRGGSYAENTQAGAFCFGSYDGVAYTGHGFRPVLTPIQ